MHHCPQRYAAPGNYLETNNYDHDRCSYCGSLPPDLFISLVKMGKKLTPTDKNYKVYVETEVGTLGLYFDHLSKDQQTEFASLLATDTAKLGYPGYFYVKPFFLNRG